MQKKLAIIDPVGIKAGMNYYDVNLLKSLSKKGIAAFLYSNFQEDVIEVKVKQFYRVFYKSKIKQFANLFLATIRSCIDCKKNRVNVVILHLFSAQIESFFVFMICKIFGLKIIAISHDVSSLLNDDIRFFRNLIYNQLSDNIVVHNSFSFNFLLPFVNSKSVNNISIIKHGSFTDMPDVNINKSYARQQLGLDKNGKYLLFFGQIKKVKRLDILLEAMKDVTNDVKLIIAGKVWKDDFSFYQNIIDKNNLSHRVKLDIQFIMDDKKELYFKASDLVVLPYEKIFQSGVLFTAMSYGMASICSDIPAFRDVVDDNINGFLFQKNNRKELAEKINYVVSHEDQLAYIGNSAREKMINIYSWEKIASDYLKII